MDREIVVSAVEKIFEAGGVEYFYVRLAGKLTRVNDEELIISAASGIEVPIKKSAVLERPNVVTVDLESGKKTIGQSAFEELIGKNVSVNCFLDNDGSWRATDIFTKTTIDKKPDGQAET